MSTVVSSSFVRSWAQRALSDLGAARDDIDALNVFPVPDGDTGTNLYLTMESACQSVEDCWDGEGEPPAAEAAKAMATGALLGARGNSGVILSQILRGTSDVLAGLPDGEVLDGRVIQRLLARAADLGYEAVARPVEGTILTVARAAADAASRVVQDGVDDATAVVTAAAAGARDALEATPTMLEALRLAGVVDAGGRGLVVVLDAFAAVVAGVAQAVGEPGLRVPVPRPVEAEVSRHYGGPAYEVMYLLDSDDADAVVSMRGELDALGDSLVVVGGDGLWNVHVHVDDAGAAVEAAMRAGRPYRIRITHLEPAPVGRTDHVRALVAVTHGPGTAALLGEIGAGIVPAAAQQRPSTAELLGAIRQVHAAEVVVLPSDSDTQAVAEVAAQQAREGGTRVAVIPTRSIVQTLAAAAVHDPDADFDDDVVSMTRAAGATRYAAVTIASRAALTTVGPCQEGDVLGLVDGDIAAIGSDLAVVVRDLLAGMLAIGGELGTIVLGAEAGAELRRDLPQWLEREYPLVDVVVHEGGQPLWPVIVGVE
ncbi:MAG: DAK2 domain-containing protein [Actinomycetales bacterium]|nr:DAK2 domain-containing protein [Actinomycetales bacterium]